MFTGIIEDVGTVKDLNQEGGNLRITLSCGFTTALKIDQSVAHNGCCLTVVDVADDAYTVVAVKETLEKTNLGSLTVGDQVNLERCMLADGRFDGHIVQGHVDTVAICKTIEENEGSWRFVFAYSDGLLVEKGSITVNGISLTVFNVTPNTFEVAIIPYTYEHTNLKHLAVNDRVNIEFDIVGKYIAKLVGKG